MRCRRGCLSRFSRSMQDAFSQALCPRDTRDKKVTCSVPPRPTTAPVTLPSQTRSQINASSSIIANIFQLGSKRL